MIYIYSSFKYLTIQKFNPFKININVYKFFLKLIKFNFFAIRFTYPLSIREIKFAKYPFPMYINVQARTHMGYVDLAANVSYRLCGSRSKEAKFRKRRVRMNSHLIPAHFIYDSYTQCSPSEVVVYHFRYLTVARLSDGLPFVSSLDEIPTYPHNVCNVFKSMIYVYTYMYIYAQAFSAKKWLANGMDPIRVERGN